MYKVNHANTTQRNSAVFMIMTEALKKTCFHKVQITSVPQRFVLQF